MSIELSFQVVIILICFGFLAAFIDSIVGGGGLISLPALMFLGLSPASAVATNKLAASFGSFTSTLTFLRSGNVELRRMAKYIPVVFIGSLVGAYCVTLMDPQILKPLMLIMLVAVLIYTIFKKDWGSISTFEKLSNKRIVAFACLMFLIGCYDGFMGPGTGSFLIFAFLMIGFDFLRAAGNAKILNFTSNIAALILFAIVGQINIAFGLIMAIGQIAGAVTGARFAMRKGSSFVRILFIIVTVILLAKNTYDYFFS